MSRSDKPKSERRFDSLSDRFRNALRSDKKKDSQMGHRSSPVSPLRSHSGPIATSTSSSSSSSGSFSGKFGSNPDRTRSDGSGELYGSRHSSPSGVEGGRSTERKLNSSTSPLIYGGGSGGSSSSNVAVGVGGGSLKSPALPAGNICPSGKFVKTGMTSKNSNRTDVLGLGTGNYGHGSVMRGGAGGKLSVGDLSEFKHAMMNSDLAAVKKAGNEHYRRGNFVEALHLYDQAILKCPANATCRSNRAAALIGLGRLAEAVRECEEAVRLDPGYERARQRLASLYLRLGQVENAKKHLCFPGQQPDPSEWPKVRTVESHLIKCTNVRKIGDWKSTLKEVDATIAAGAESSPQLFACRAETLLKLQQLEDADSAMANIPKFGAYPPSCSLTKFFGMLSEAYVFYVRAQIEMAFGRFENAVADVEKAGQIDPQNAEVTLLANNVKLVARTRARGNDFFNSGKFVEACAAYGEGLELDPSNSVLYCNRAVCWSQLSKWERSVEDCTQALRIRPNYTKALLRRAVSNGKLERWAESVRDYEVLRRENPGDGEVAEALFHAQDALKKSRGEEVPNLKFGGKVEEVSNLDQFRAAISSPGLSVVQFKAASNEQCEHISPFVDMLCVRYPCVNFLKVDVEESMTIAKAENVSIVPTFKIYKNHTRLKVMICPDRQVLENSVRHYSLLENIV